MPSRGSHSKATRPKLGENPGPLTQKIEETLRQSASLPVLDKLATCHYGTESGVPKLKGGPTDDYRSVALQKYTLPVARHGIILRAAEIASFNPEPTARPGAIGIPLYGIPPVAAESTSDKQILLAFPRNRR